MSEKAPTIFLTPENMQEAVKAFGELKSFLLVHESDIAEEISDFGSLKNLFKIFVKREPKVELS